MLPAEQTNIEKTVEVPVGAQNSDEPEIREDVPDQPREAEQPPTKKDDDEKIIDDQEDQQQSPPVNLKYKI
ncbi:protein nep- isoform c [Lasius niger]|uniref:Protein nep-isoform c n=1 Tax=Lasius niger TaxID=67767 RepID=A0A0J7K362_LASNI|nr:protein nep- isoform c [Lasius niger]